MGPAWCWPKRGVRTDDHEGELTVAPEVLDALPVQGRVVTSDALYCQRHLCQQILERGGEYLVIVKGNQQKLFIEQLTSSPLCQVGDLTFGRQAFDAIDDGRRDVRVEEESPHATRVARRLARDLREMGGYRAGSASGARQSPPRRSE